MTDSNHTPSEAAGVAALSICESLLLALCDLKVMCEKDAGDVLRDAAAAHHNVGATATQPHLHRDVAVIIDQLIASTDPASPK